MFCNDIALYCCREVELAWAPLGWQVVNNNDVQQLCKVVDETCIIQTVLERILDAYMPSLVKVYFYEYVFLNILGNVLYSFR